MNTNHTEGQPMREPSRYSLGGLCPRFVVQRVDGKPCRPEARYMVLDGSGADPAAWWALRLYAELVKPGTEAERTRRLVAVASEATKADIAANRELSEDLTAALSGVWPTRLAQHGDAK